MKSIKYVDLVFKFIFGNFSYLYLLELQYKDIEITKLKQCQVEVKRPSQPHRNSAEPKQGSKVSPTDLFQTFHQYGLQTMYGLTLSLY